MSYTATAICRMVRPARVRLAPWCFASPSSMANSHGFTTKRYMAFSASPEAYDSVALHPPSARAAEDFSMFMLLWVASAAGIYITGDAVSRASSNSDSEEARKKFQEAMRAIKEYGL